ncbi:MAG: hypothetical protein AUG49_16000 [Catenulispora sp. 13_1_20CM_3_70_7]|nr:MAG: hypothetical protein AUG49_16000 [Catenulispora sp. 13_1_20CM_3_70_7]
MTQQQSFTITAPSGVLVQTGLGFAASAVVVDNFSNQWLLLPDVPKFVAPNSLNVVMAVDGLTSGRAHFEAPVGQTQQPNPGGSAQITWLATPQPTQAGYAIATTTQLQSVSDPRDFVPTINHPRGIITDAAEREYLSAQIGRTLARDDFENATIQWGQVGGTVVGDTAQALKGTRSLKLTAAAGAGNQAIARKFASLAADQFVSTFPLLVVEVWFQAFDTNWRDLQVFVRPDDTVKKYQAAVRYHNQQAGVAQGNVQYLDSTGTFQTIQAYPVRAAAGAVSDSWHHLMLAMNYLQGTGGYLTYQLIKFDDVTWKPASSTGATWNLNNPAAQAQATASVRETSVDLILSNDSGVAAAAARYDEFLLCDLSNAFQL